MNFCKMLARSAALLVLVVSDRVSAEWRFEVGPAFTDGKNDYGPDPRSGPPNDDWRSVDRGSGFSLAYEHRWDQLYMGIDAQSLQINNRNDRIRVICGGGGPGPGLPPFDSCLPVTDAYRYDDRYQNVVLNFGWRQPVSQRVSFQAGFGLVHERWKNSGGVRVFLPTVGDPLPIPLSSTSRRQTSWSSNVSAEFDATETLKLSAGLAYQHKGYFAAVDRDFYANRGLGSDGDAQPLLEAVLRAEQALGERFDMFLEYRPSDQRQYWQAGVGYRF